MFEAGSMLRTCLSFAFPTVLLAVLLCTPADGRLLLTAAATHPVAHALHVASDGTRADRLRGVPLTRAQLGAILGTSLGALMLAGLWAMRCCLRHVSADRDHLFADGERSNSPLLTPRTPESPRGSEGRRSWCSSPAAYTAPPVKLLSSPKADLSHGVSGGAVLLFTKGQLADTREALCQQVDDFVLTALESHFAGITTDWLGDGCESVIGPHTSLVERKQFELRWAKHRLWQWLESNVWSGDDNPLVARGKVRDQAINLSNGDGVTKTQAARELLSAIKKNPNHKAFRTALTTFTQQLLSQMTAPAQPVEPSAGQAAAAAAVNAVMESALLLQLQMLGTSAGMQIFVPGTSSAAGLPDDAVVYDDDHSPSGSDNSQVLCTKPGVLELKSLGGIFQSVVVLPAHASTSED